jgi:SAM-dependent methyltransferase
MVGGEGHSQVVRQQFGVQASRFDSYIVSDGGRDTMSWILENLEMQPDFKVLDVAAGTGLVARNLAPFVQQVVALDTTPEMLAQGRDQAEVEGVNNITFQEGDAKQLPYPDEAFDLVTCRIAVHHFENPSEQVKEMARVCRPDGHVAVIDVTTSEDPEVADLHNRLERLRDPSHTKALCKDELTSLLEGCGLRIVLSSNIEAHRTLQEWMDLTHTSPAARDTILQAMERELAGGPLTGMQPFRQDGELRFRHQWLMLVGRKSV